MVQETELTQRAAVGVGTGGRKMETRSGEAREQTNKARERAMRSAGWVEQGQVGREVGVGAQSVTETERENASRKRKLAPGRRERRRGALNLL